MAGLDPAIHAAPTPQTVDVERGLAQLNPMVAWALRRWQESGSRVSGLVFAGFDVIRKYVMLGRDPWLSGSVSSTPTNIHMYVITELDPIIQAERASLNVGIKYSSMNSAQFGRLVVICRVDARIKSEHDVL